jgi:hypothetical protein
MSAAAPAVLGLGAALLVLAFLPGIVVAHTLFSRPRPLDVLVLGPALGFAAVAFGAYVWNLVPGVAGLPGWAPLVLGLTTVLVASRAGLTSLRQRGVWLDAAPGEGEAAEAIGVTLLAAAVFAGFFVGFDRDLFAFDALHRAVAIATRVAVGDVWELSGTTPQLLTENYGATHGVVALLSPLPSVLGFLGMRAAHAGLHVGLAGAVYVGARRAGASGLGAMLGFAVASLHPVLVDPTDTASGHAALAVTAVAFAAMLSIRQPGAGTAASTNAPGPGSSRVAAIGAGWVLALAVGAFHPLVLSLPGVAVLVWTGVAPTQRWRFSGLLLLGLATGLAPFVLHHVAVGALEPSLVSMTDPSHWNWPVHHTMVRSPHRLLPGFIAGPLGVSIASGSVLVGLVAVGLVRLPPGVRLASALFLVPPLLLLPYEGASSPQFLVPWAAPLLLAAAFGLDGVRGAAGKTGWTVVGAAVLAAAIGGRGVLEVDVPVDPRAEANDVDWPEVAGEREALRDRVAWVWPWPQWAGDGRGLAERLTSAAEDLAQPGWSSRRASPREQVDWQVSAVNYGFVSKQLIRDEKPPPLDGVHPLAPRVVVDLAVPWPTDGPGVRLARADERNVNGFEKPRRYGLDLPWLPYKPDLHMFRSPGSPRDSYVVLSNPKVVIDPRAMSLDAQPAASPPVNSLFHSLKGVEVVVVVPEGTRLHLVYVPSSDPSHIWRWIVTSEEADDEPTVRGPRAF